MREVEAGDKLQGGDLRNPDRVHAIVSPAGEVILPRPRPGYRFVRWEHKPTRDGAWVPVPAHGHSYRYVRAHYEREG